VVAGLDARAGQVAVRGWTEGGGRSVADLLAVFEDAGVAAVVFTEIARDGTLAGPDLAQFAAVVASTAVPVIASGGVGGVADIEALARLEAGGRRLAGVIVGKALHDGLFTVGQGVAACAV
jgi:phosphoribosylformimino-5-aminoimidazole carboxamide ribotide isomerase